MMTYKKGLKLKAHVIHQSDLRLQKAFLLACRTKHILTQD